MEIARADERDSLNDCNINNIDSLIDYDRERDSLNDRNIHHIDSMINYVSES